MAKDICILVLLNGFPVSGISFRFGRRNKIHKEYCIIENVIILGSLMADPSSKHQKMYIFCKICHIFTLY